VFLRHENAPAAPGKAKGEVTPRRPPARNCYVVQIPPPFSITTVIIRLSFSPPKEKIPAQAAAKNTHLVLRLFNW
jgi:hypothetical protein